MIRGISVHTPRQDSPAESHKKFDVGDERRTVLQPASFDVSMSRVEHLQTETKKCIISGNDEHYPRGVSQNTCQHLVTFTYLFIYLYNIRENRQ